MREKTKASQSFKGAGFDSHAHLNFKAFNNDYPKIIKKCLEENLWLINVGSKYNTSEKAVDIAEKCEKGVWAAVGLHPIHIEDEVFNYQKYLELAKNPKVAAIGETGLDYRRITNDELRIKNLQKEVFKKQIELAMELNKPLIIHCRDAHDDVVKILDSCFKIHVPRLRGVIHCFTGNSQQAEQYLELGFLLGFTGIITYSSDYDAIIKDIPLEKILIETDCPYLTPLKMQTDADDTQTNADNLPRQSASSPRKSAFIRNEPLYVKYVAQKIAEIRGLSLEKTAEQTFRNALRLFKI